MKRTELEKILEDYDYTVHGGAYAVLENDDIVGDHPELVEDMRIATSAHGECVVCLDGALEDDDDAASVLAYCGLYAGQ